MTFTKEHIPWNKGKKMSEEYRKKLSISHIGQVSWNKKPFAYCKIEGCNRSDIKGHGYCNLHYTKRRHRKSNNLDYSDESLSTRIPRSDEHIQKFIHARKGKSNSLKGKTYEEIYDTEKAKKMKLCHSKQNNVWWLGGKSFELYGEEFCSKLKELIRNRDNCKCQICGVPQMECIEKLSIHHIDYNKKNNDPKNLISLCRKCHFKTNNIRYYWIGYFQDLKGIKYVNS